MMIEKAVIPAAGRGTRVADLSGQHPKECLEVSGLPMIALALLELSLSGFREVAVVVSPDKRELVDCLRNLPPFPSRSSIARLFPVEAHLEPRGDWPEVALFEQTRPRGVIDALSRARDYLEGQSFALVMPDNLLTGDRPAMDVLREAHAQHDAPMVGLSEVRRGEADTLGNCGRVELAGLSGGVFHVTRLDGKATGRFEIPAGQESAMRAIGRSIVPHSFATLDPDPPQEGSPGARAAVPEIDDVPRFQEFVRQGRLLGVFLSSRVHDLGQPDGLSEARRALGASFSST